MFQEFQAARRHEHPQGACVDFDFDALSGAARLAVGLNPERRGALDAQTVECDAANVLRADVLPAPHVVGMTQRVAQMVPAEEPDVEQTVVEVGVGRKFRQPAEVMPDVGGDRHDVMPLHLRAVCPQAQLHAVPLQRLPDGLRRVFGQGEELFEADARLDVVNGQRIQPDARPHHERILVARADINRVDGRVGEQGGVLLQHPGMRPRERTQTEFDAPHVRRARRQDAQRGLAAAQTVDHVANGAIAADGKDRISFLRRRLLRQLDGVCAAERFRRVHLPAGRFQRPHSRLDERLDVEPSRRRVIDDDCASHTRDYNLRK